MVRYRSDKYSAILLSAGAGNRMNSDIPKQYMDLKGKMILRYSLETFEHDERISEIVIVANEAWIDTVKENIVKQYGYTKVTDVVIGGKERYESVYKGLCALKDADYVMIHDGARPFVDHEMIVRLTDAVRTHKACIPAVKSKDTIRLSDDEGFVTMTPDRNNVWNIQTPQTFEYVKLKSAFDDYMSNTAEYGPVTDDAMVWELVTGDSVKIVEGSYNNIKITTPEDISVGEGIAYKMSKSEMCDN